MTAARLLHWSTWRRRHQATARRSHYQRRSADEPAGQITKPHWSTSRSAAQGGHPLNGRRAETLPMPEPQPRRRPDGAGTDPGFPGRPEDGLPHAHGTGDRIQIQGIKLCVWSPGGTSSPNGRGCGSTPPGRNRPSTCSISLAGARAADARRDGDRCRTCSSHQCPHIASGQSQGGWPFGQVVSQGDGDQWATDSRRHGGLSFVCEGVTRSRACLKLGGRCGRASVPGTWHGRRADAAQRLTRPRDAGIAPVGLSPAHRPGAPTPAWVGAHTTAVTCRLQLFVAGLFLHVHVHVHAP
ncbi:hypothetical protein SANTM175S_02092 [Streptomyces antimycoticus]